VAVPQTVQGVAGSASSSKSRPAHGVHASAPRAANVPAAQGAQLRSASGTPTADVPGAAASCAPAAHCVVGAQMRSEVEFGARVS
jgi:hypothetical protein